MKLDVTAADRLPPEQAMHRRFFVVAMVVALFGIGMTVFLNYFKFQSALESAVRSRLLLLAGNVDESVQRALAIGLPLAAIPALPELLARERAADPAIHSIGIFDATGRMLYSTDAKARGQRAPAAWRAAAQRSAAESWQLADGESAVVGLGLRNSFDLEVGHVAIHYSRDGIAAALSGMRGELAAIALWGVLGTVVLAGVALHLALRQVAQPGGG